MNTRPILRYVRKQKFRERIIYMAELEDSEEDASYTDVFLERFHELFEPVMKSIQNYTDVFLSDILWDVKDLYDTILKINAENSIFMMFGVHKNGVDNDVQIKTNLDMKDNLNMYDEIFYFAASKIGSKRIINLYKIVPHLK